MSRGLGASASGKSCSCNPKEKSNWNIVEYAGKKKTVYCNKCHAQWDTSAKYVEELSKASYLK